MVAATRVSSLTSSRKKHGEGLTRLAYMLTLGGRSQPVRVSVIDPDTDRHIADKQLKRMQGQLHPLDAAIIDELFSSTVFGLLPDSKIARLIPLLAQRRTEIEGQQIKLWDEDEALKPRVQIETNASGRMEMTLGLVDEDGDWFSLKEGRLLAGTVAYYLRAHHVIPVQSDAPWELASWAIEPVRELRGGANADERDAMVRKLNKAGIPREDLSLLAVQRQPPDRWVLRLEAEETPHLTARATLQAHYGAHVIDIGGYAASSPFIVPNDPLAGMVERDLVSEESARRTLRSLKFRFDKEQQCFIGKNDVALRALDPYIEFFPPYWEIERSNTPAFFKDLTLDTEIRLIEERGLIDLSIDIETQDDNDQSENANIEMDVLLKWLDSGHEYLRLDDGAYVAPSQTFRKSLKVLEDLGADKKRVLVSPLCIGLLKVIGDYQALRTADDATQSWLDEVSGNSQPRDIPPPQALTATLRDYQCHGLNWLGMLHRHHLTGILADDMGLGKTLQTLALVAHVRETEGPKPTLVIAPTSVVTVWRDEAEKFTPDLKVGLLHGPPALRAAMNPLDYDLVITSYGILRRDFERLADIGFRYVILDEAQAAKNAATQNAKAIRELKSERRLALTGTPIENRPDELWSTFDFLAPGFLGTLSQFRKRYARPIEKNDKDASFILRSRIQPLILRRLKTEVAKELPPKIEQVLRCQMDEQQRALYDHITARSKQALSQRIAEVGVNRTHVEILAALTRLRQICCDPAILTKGAEGIPTPPSAKLDLFAELMREALGSGRTVVVFSQFVEMQKRIIAKIKELGIEPLWLHGGTRNRDKVVARFQDPEGPPVIVVSLKAGGTGLTLTRADTVIHYDPWWNPAVERQATDRAHRLGQDKTVYVYKLICIDTVEEKVLQMAEKKERIAASLIGSEGESGEKKITSEEVLALLG